MYSIVGADGKEYGPVDIAVLVQWAHDGRVVSKTTVMDHDTGRRFLACDLAELAPVFSQTPIVAPPQQMTPRSPMSPPAPFPSVPTVPGMYVTKPRRSRLVAGILGILFGWLGIHRYYLGYNGIGTAMLLISLCTCFVASPLTAIWGLVEGILCLTGAMTDAEGNPLGV